MSLFTHSFFYPGQLPGTNDIVAGARMLVRRGRNGRGSRYSVDKKKIVSSMVAVIRSRKIPPMNRIYVRFTWHEARANRDPDNIVGGMKYVFDALKAKDGAGIIPNDGQKNVAGFAHKFVTSKTPGVLVEIEDFSEEVRG